ncbi:MAG: helix-turn-helix domain-containing protein [Candidatus Hodarchaeales archaeon]|jgi:response regulator of citrate/malate metabolism
MNPSKNEKVHQDNVLDNLVDAVKTLNKQISLLDHRLSVLEGSNLPKTNTTDIFDSLEHQNTPQVDFEDKDEMLKRAYQVLALAQRPMTTQEVAEKIGRSRSTTSQYLNELHQRNLLQKMHGITPDQSRNIVFSAIETPQD